MQYSWAKRAFSNYTAKARGWARDRNKTEKEIKTAGLPSRGEGVGVEAQRRECVHCRGITHPKPCHMAGWTADNV